MTARARLRRDEGVALLDRLARLAEGRAALVSKLRAVRNVVAAEVEGASEFPLWPAALAVDPAGTDPVTAFREFRRTVSDFAAGHGIELSLDVDSRKRAEPEARLWWIEGPDGTGQRLSELSAAGAGPVDRAVVPVYGRRERDGKTVVRTYFDIAPADREGAGRCVELLKQRLRTDTEYAFDVVPAPGVGDHEVSTRRDAVAAADLVIAFVSPEYLEWHAHAEREGGLIPLTGARAPLCWKTLTDRNDLGPLQGVCLFTPRPRPGKRSADSPRTMPGLAPLGRNRLDEELARFHSQVVELLGARPTDGVDVLARHLALADEPDPVTAHALRTELDKGIPATTPSAAAPSVDVLDHMVSWAAADDGRPYLVLFGEYGMGKTVATQSFTRELLKRREDDPGLPLPIYFDLRRLGNDLRSRDATLDELLADLIKRAWRSGSTRPTVIPEDVVHHVQERGAVVVFDGLDEVLVHMNERQGQSLLRELLRILPPPLVDAPGRAPGVGRVVLTCRTHFFRTVRDQHNFFRGEDRDDLEPNLYEALHLLPFTEEQIRDYLTAKRGIDEVDKAVELIRSIHDLEGLASRPYTLRLITSQIERLERRVAAGGSVDAAGLYDELVQSWLDRDEGKHEFERDHKVRLMEDLAALLWHRAARRITATDLEAWLRERLVGDDDIGRWVRLKRPDPAVLAEDLRTATFIVRPGAEEFEFAHTSLLEYFLARFLYRTMLAGDVDQWALPTVSVEALDFLVEIVAAGDTTRFVQQLAACGSAYRPLASELAVRYAMRAAGRGARVPSLRDFRLDGANLRDVESKGAEVEMTGAVLVGADLRGASLHGVCLDHADLSGARLTGAELFSCSLRSARLRQASLDGALFRRSDLEGVDVTGSTGEDCQWLWCSGTLAGPTFAVGLLAPAASTTAAGVSLEVLSGLSGRVSGVAWSPDGAWLASSDSGGVALWNPRSGMQRARLAHTGVASALAWSPDGARLASGGDGGIRLWDPDRPEAPPVVLAGHGGWVRALAWSPDGTRLASGDEDGTVRLWEPDRPEVPPVVLAGHGGWVESLTWSPDGARLASGGGGGGGVKLWDPDRPEAPPVVLAGHGDLVQALAWSPDGAWLASGGGDRTVRMWDPDRPEAPLAVLAGHGDWVRAVAWSPDGTRLASGGDDSTVRLWDPGRFDAPPAVLSGHGSWVYALAWSPDGAWLASGGGDRTVRLWDPDRPDDPPSVLAGHGGWVGALTWSPDGARLASGGDGGVRLWDPGRPEDPPSVLAGHGEWAYALAWSPDGTRLASGSDDRTVRLWDPDRPDDPPSVLAGHGEWAYALAWSPDGARLASGGDGGVRLRDPGRPEVPPTVLAGHVGWVRALAWSPDGARLASGDDGGVRLWDPGRPEVPPTVLAGRGDLVQALAWSPDGARLASGGSDRTVRLWDPGNPDAPLAVLSGHGDWVRAVAWSPDGTRLASGGDDRTVRLWDPDRPDAPLAVLPGHGDWAYALAWSPDGARLAVGSSGAVHLWDVSAGVVLTTIHVFARDAWCVVDADGRILCAEGEVWRWLRWRRRGRLTKAMKAQPLLAAEAFGPLPGVDV